jgi:hypothetical protein
MPAPTTYSTDQDLVPVYVSDAALLPDSLAPQHEAAFAAINRDLAAQGWDAEDLAALSEATIAALVAPSCCYVMHLLHREKIASERGTESLDKAKFWRDEYARELAATAIVTTLADVDDPPSTRGGYVVLG